MSFIWCRWGYAAVQAALLRNVLGLPYDAQLSDEQLMVGVRMGDDE